jgi:F-box-like
MVQPSGFTRHSAVVIHTFEMSGFGALPDEVCLAILARLSAVDLACLAATSRPLRALILGIGPQDDTSGKRTDEGAVAGRVWRRIAARLGWGSTDNLEVPDWPEMVLGRFRAQGVVAGAWNRIDDAFALEEQLVRDGASHLALMDSVVAVEKLLGRPLPPEFFGSVFRSDGTHYSPQRLTARTGMKLLSLGEIAAALEDGSPEDGEPILFFPVTEEEGIHQLRMDSLKGTVWLHAGWDRTLFATSWVRALERLFSLGDA